MSLYTSSPVCVSFPDADAEAYISLNLVPRDAENVELTLVSPNEEEVVIKAALKDTITTPLGRLVVHPADTYEAWLGKEITVTHIPRENMMGYFHVSPRPIAGRRRCSHY